MLTLQDLNNETLARMEADNRRQTLAEEIEFLKQVHEQVSKILPEYKSTVLVDSGCKLGSQQLLLVV